MSDISTIFIQFFQRFFSVDPTDNWHYLLSFVQTLISEPLFMAVIAMFFAGFIISIFIRIFHTA